VGRFILDCFDKIGGGFRIGATLKDMMSKNQQLEFTQSMQSLQSEVQRRPKLPLPLRQTAEGTVIDPIQSAYVFRELKVMNTGEDRGLTVMCGSNPIPKGTIVGRLGGDECHSKDDVISRENKLRSYGVESPHMFFTARDGKSASEHTPVIDTHYQNIHKYGIMQLINHSNDDNECNTQFVGERPMVLVVSTRLIAPNEELIINYGNGADFEAEAAPLNAKRKRVTQYSSLAENLMTSTSREALKAHTRNERHKSK
jgi:hypothetical protein